MTLPWVETKAFQDQVVLIVGAGQGIGEGLARRFAEAGAAVVHVCHAWSKGHAVNSIVFNEAGKQK